MYPTSLNLRMFCRTLLELPSYSNKSSQQCRYKLHFGILLLQFLYTSVYHSLRHVCTCNIMCLSDCFLVSFAAAEMTTEWVWLNSRCAHRGRESKPSCASWRHCNVNLWSLQQYSRAHTRYTTTTTKVFKLYCHVLQPYLNIKLKCIDVEIWNDNNKKYIGIFSPPYVPLWIKASPCSIFRLQSCTHSTSFHFISPQCLICYASSEIEVGFQAISSDGWWKHMGSTWKARSNASSSNNGFGQVDVTSGKSWQSWRTDMPCKLSGCGLSWMQLTLPMWCNLRVFLRQYIWIHVAGRSAHVHYYVNLMFTLTSSSMDIFASLT